jgi:MoaA/NifB/PqqE/SkfB family radical SAM enzyme
VAKQTAPSVEGVGQHKEDVPTFRIDERLNQILLEPEERPVLAPGETPLTLPDPVYPQRPENPDGSDFGYNRVNTIRGFKTWAAPFVKSRWYKNDLRPIIAYLFTEYKCNLDCHYCWSYDNRVKGMTEDTARRSIDWLHSIGNRVLALMGGEPLLRPNFIHKVVYYGARKGFFVYLPTNGRLMKPEITDKLGDAGLATVNLAVDAVEEKPGLPKALALIRPYFEYLVEQRKRYGYTVVFNINICRTNMEDVKQLTEIAHDYGIYSDYHIVESPMLEQDDHFKHMDNNSTYIRPENYGEVDDLIDWLCEKHDEGYIIVNPKQQFHEMKDLMRGQVKPWECRAGQNTVIIREDGTLAPCFPMYSSNYDWGIVGNDRFEKAQLDEMKVSCNKHCLSTCNYILSYCYDTTRVLKWIGKQAARGFNGVSGSFD